MTPDADHDDLVVERKRLENELRFQAYLYCM